MADRRRKEKTSINPLEIAGSLNFTPEQIRRLADAELRRAHGEGG